jgi:hypothetical protein
VTYANAAPTLDAARTVSVVANDGTANSNTATRTITVAAVNDAPVVTMTASALAFTEGNGATAVDAGLTVTDADSPTWRVRRCDHGQLRDRRGSAGLRDAERDHGQLQRDDGVWTLSGSATVANYQAALRSVTYANAAPTLDGDPHGVGGRNDGTANSNTATRTITVGAVNDAPVVTMTASALAFTEGNGATPSTPA